MASLLLGMLMTILTMIFNQSSISWRVGEASVSDLDDASDGIAAVHDIADNLYFWGKKGQESSYLLTSPWDDDGVSLRTARPLETTGDGTTIYQGKFSSVGQAVKNSLLKPGNWGAVGVGSDESESGGDVYTVNVKSAGPNRQWNDWDDIWSFPDEFD